MNAQDAYAEKMEAKLKEINAELDKLAAQAEQAQIDAQAEFQRQLDEARTKRDETRKRLAALQEAGGGAFDEMKAGVERAWSELGASFRAAQSKFK